MRKVFIKSSSLIDFDIYKNTKAVIDFALKKLDQTIVKSEDYIMIEQEIVDLLMKIYKDFRLVHRDLNYDLLNIAIINLLDQAKSANGINKEEESEQEVIKPKKKSKKFASENEEQPEEE